MTAVVTPTTGFNLTAASNFIQFLITQDNNALAIIESLASSAGGLATMFPSLAPVEAEAQAALKVFLGILNMAESLFPGTTPLAPVVPKT